MLRVLIIAHILLGGICAEVTMTISPAEVEVGQAVVLTCIYPPGTEIIKITWFFDEAVLALSDKVKIGQGNLINTIQIQPVTSDDNGTYKCDVFGTLNGEIISKTVKGDLHVLVPPSSLSLSITPDRLDAGKAATITCSIPKVWPLADLTVEIHKGNDIIKQQKSPQGRPVEGDPLAHSVTVSTSVDISKMDNGKKVRCWISWRDRTLDEGEDLVVYYPPLSLRLEKLPASPVTQGSRVQIICSHEDANPQPTLRLIHLNPYSSNSTSATSRSPAAVVVSGTQNVHYDANNVTKTWNNATFSCEAEGGALTSVLRAQRTVAIEVLFSTDRLVMTERPREMIREEGITNITCVTGAANPTPKVNWEHPSDIVGMEELIETPIVGEYGALKLQSTYKLTASRPLNGAMYKCSLGGRPDISHNVTVEVKFEGLQAIKGDVIGTPEGQNARLTCNSSESNPQTTFEWQVQLQKTAPERWEDITYHTGIYGGQTSEATLTLYRVNRSHHGVLVTCTPRFDGVPLNEKMLKMLLNVTYPPVVEAQLPMPGPIKENNPLRIRCVESVRGNPAVYTYSWYYSQAENAVINQTVLERLNTGIGEVGGVRKLEQRGDVLEVERAQDADAGTYWCQASNHGGDSDLASITVQVTYRPKEIQQSASNVHYAQEKEQVQLNLTVSTFPAPSNCKWSLKQADSTIIDMPTENIKIQARGDKIHVCSLTLPPVESSSYGTYTATVNNTAGELDVSFELKPYGLPGPPVAVIVSSHPSEKLFTLSWYSGQNGGYTQTFSVYMRPVKNTPGAGDGSVETEWIRSESGIIDKGIGQLNRHDISYEGEEYTVYEFKVSSVNKAGEKNSTKMRGRTDTAPLFNGNYTYTVLAAAVDPETGAAATDNDLILHWSSLSSSTYDQLILKRCLQDKCVYFADVSGAENEWRIPGSSVTKGASYRLVALYGGSEIDSSPPFKEVKMAGDGTGKSGGTNTAAVAGGVIAFIVILLILVVAVIAVVLVKRQRRKKRAEGKDAGEMITHSGNYVAVPNNASGRDNTSPYDEVLVRSPATGSNAASATSPDIVSSHTRPAPTPRKKPAESKVDSLSPRGLSVSIPPTSPRVLEPQYENVADQSEPLYDNVNVRNGRASKPESVIYAQLDLPEISEGDSPLIVGDTDKTEYVAIDFNRAPLPPDTDSD